MHTRSVPRIARPNSMRRRGWDYASSGWYFITACTIERQHLFGAVTGGRMELNPLGRIVRQEWKRTHRVRPSVHLDAFIVMPNHFHAFLHLKTRGHHARSSRGATRLAHGSRPHGPAPGSIGAIMAQFKSIVTKRIGRHIGDPCCEVWQRNYHDRIIPCQERDLMVIRAYIRQNPAKWAENPENAE